MTILYSSRLKSNFLLLELDEQVTVEQVISTAHMHSADRVCCGGRHKYALARMKANGTQENERWVPKAALARYV